ncbi:hypothetical protein MMC13_004061 [Lambiella insularis]|nr:hypothetical protein [Lambiella insularis]
MPGTINRPDSGTSGATAKRAIAHRDTGFETRPAAVTSTATDLMDPATTSSRTTDCFLYRSDIICGSTPCNWIDATSCFLLATAFPGIPYASSVSSTPSGSASTRSTPIPALSLVFAGLLAMNGVRLSLASLLLAPYLLWSLCMSSGVNGWSFIPDVTFSSESINTTYSTAAPSNTSPAYRSSDTALATGHGLETTTPGFVPITTLNITYVCVEEATLYEAIPTATAFSTEVTVVASNGKDLAHAFVTHKGYHVTSSAPSLLASTHGLLCAFALLFVHGTFTISPSVSLSLSLPLAALCAALQTGVDASMELEIPARMQLRVEGNADSLVSPVRRIEGSTTFRTSTTTPTLPMQTMTPEQAMVAWGVKEDLTEYHYQCRHQNATACGILVKAGERCKRNKSSKALSAIAARPTVRAREDTSAELQPYAAGPKFERLELSKTPVTGTAPPTAYLRGAPTLSTSTTVDGNITSLASSDAEAAGTSPTSSSDSQATANQNSGGIWYGIWVGISAVVLGCTSVFFIVVIWKHYKSRRGHATGM